MKINAHFRFIGKNDTVIFVCLTAAVIIAEILFVPKEKAAFVGTVIYTIFFGMAALFFYGMLRAAIQRNLPGNKYFRSIPGAFSLAKKAWFWLEVWVFIITVIGVGGSLIIGLKACAVLPMAALIFVFHSLLRPILLLVKNSVAVTLIGGITGAFGGGFAVGFGLGDELSKFFEDNAAAACIVCAVVVVSEAVSLIITYKKLPEVYNG